MKANVLNLSLRSWINKPYQNKMIDKIKEHIAEVRQFSADSMEAVEVFRIKYLGKKGLLNQFFGEFKNVPNGEKKEFGQAINELKQLATERIASLKDSISGSMEEKENYLDLTRPGEPMEMGARHPISIVRNRIIEIFSRIGFNVS